MAKLTGVHGIGMHQRGRHQLLATWGPALADGLERAAGHRVEQPSVDLAFYGDLYLPVPRTAGKAAAGRKELDWDGLTDQEITHLRAWLSDALTPEQIASVPSAAEKGYTRVPRPLQALLYAFDRCFGAAAAVLYLGVLRQVHRYLADPGLKAAVDARVKEAVTPDCRVLVGHSLGSVVAYEYLRQNPEHRVEAFITAGSPLGLRMVRERIVVEDLPVGLWTTVRDLRDPVACAGRLGTWWPQIAAQEEVVVDNGGDAHAVERYLSSRTTGALVLRTLPELARA
ncbi:hypothetical protein AB0M11_05170 [Streptomyces sp. NPDC051987]|uniref:hypothetical protein n=1 Tax=Streptomyces sp. NPDC051987 TaxID=3155808 RepID=UPI00344160BD